MDVRAERAAGIALLAALLLSRMAAGGERGSVLFSPPGGDGGSPGCARPEGRAGGLGTAGSAGFGSTFRHFQIGNWIIADCFLKILGYESFLSTKKAHRGC